MKNAKLLTILSSFSKEEMKSFGKFISSPYFNSKRDFNPLFSILSKHHPDFESANLTEKKIFTKIYPGKPYNGKSDLSIRVLYSQLTALSEKFLTIEGFQKNEAFQHNCLLKELYLKKLYEIFYSKKSTIDKENQNKKVDFSNLLKVILVESEVIDWHSISKKDYEKRYRNTSICEEALIIYFIYQMTDINGFRNKDLLKDAERSDLTANFFRHFDFDSYIESLKYSNKVNADWLKIIYYLDKVEKDKNYSDGYEILKKIFLENYNTYSLKLNNRLLLSLLNYCVYQTMGDRIKFIKEYIMFYNILIKENIDSLENDVFSIVHIRNYIRYLIQLKRYKEIDHYFKTYYDHISVDIREDSINYSKGSVEFSKGNFKKALEHFSKVNFSIPMMIKDIKMIKLKCFYELGYFDMIKSEVNTYRHFLSTTSLIPASYIKADKRYLMFLIRLSNYTEKNRNEELFNLKKDIESGPLNDNTRWILEKIEALI